MEINIDKFYFNNFEKFRTWKAGEGRNVNRIMYKTHKVKYTKLLNIGIYTVTGQEK